MEKWEHDLDNIKCGAIFILVVVVFTIYFATGPHKTFIEQWHEDHPGKTVTEVAGEKAHKVTHSFWKGWTSVDTK